MNLAEWKKEADMPVFRDGAWIDLETGIPFSAWKPAVKAASKAVIKETIAELRAQCERLTNGQRGAISRKAGVAGYEAAVAAATLAVEEGQRLLAGKATKAQYVAHAEMNANASRAMNAARIATGGK